MKVQDSLDDLLIRGLDDWIQAAEVASVSYTTGGAESMEARRDLSLRLIRELLDEGLVEVGMVVKQRGFVPWDLSIDDAMQRIANDWPTEGTGPGLGEVCWLSLTEKGRARAESLWSRKVEKEG